MSKTSIIQRRELDPLRSKAGEIVRHYEKAANCITSVMGADCISVEYSNNPKSVLFCSLCKRYKQCTRKLESYEYPCTDMHLDATKEARKRGGLYVYTCPVGFFFWVSPFFSGERFAGAMVSSGCLAVDTQQAQDTLFEICKGEIPRTEIAQYLDGIPQKNNDEVEALAHVMQLCAEKVSTSEFFDDYPEDDGIQCFRINLENYSDRERRIFACLRRGDSGEARRIVREILNDVDVSSGENLECVKLKAVEIVTLLSRAGINSDNHRELVEANNRYLKRIDDSKTSAEVIENLCLTAQMMAGRIFSFQGIRHASALRKAERFIWENYTRKISLKEVADVSGLSAPYFSTIFKDEMGENFSHYLNRLRVEKASSMLKETAISFSGISIACGFEDQAWFSKTFKNFTGVSPCKYRECGGSVPK